jgi:hypothetical protein
VVCRARRNKVPAVTDERSSKQIALDAAVEQRDAEGGKITASTVLERRDFKIGPMPLGLVVGNAVTVQIALGLRAR